MLKVLIASGIFLSLTFSHNAQTQEHCWSLSAVQHPSLSKTCQVFHTICFSDNFSNATLLDQNNRDLQYFSQSQNTTYFSRDRALKIVFFPREQWRGPRASKAGLQLEYLSAIGRSPFPANMKCSYDLY
jgi:hypothetical protein